MSMLLAGYVATVQVDQGDSWVNAVDPKEFTVTAHKECAWNQELLQLDSDTTDLKPIKSDEANGLMCDICEKPLTEQAYYLFQAVAIRLGDGDNKDCHCSECRWKRAQAHDKQAESRSKGMDEHIEGTTQSGAAITLYIEQELSISYVSIEDEHIGFIRFNFNPDFPQDAKALYTALLEVRSIIAEE